MYGVEHGNNQYTSLPNNSVSSQSDLAAKLGISVDTLQNYKMMAEMIPELEELMNTGIVTKTTALAMMRNLSEEEQEEFLNSIPTDKKYTQKQMNEEIQKYKNRISELIQQGTKAPYKRMRELLGRAIFPVRFLYRKYIYRSLK